MTLYDFKTLSPADFERLVGDLLNADLGLHLQSYPAGRDQGIDLRDATTAEVTIVQCKHYARSTYSMLLAATTNEAGKPGRLAASRYLLVTSLPLTALQQARLATSLAISAGDVWGQHALNDALGRNPDVERACFKLWLPSTAVLESILNAGRWNRSRALLEDLAPRARYWVDTAPYAAVRTLLSNNGVCVVGGPPGLGKTFLMDIIALRSSAEDWEVIDLKGRGVEEGWDAFRDGVKQLFIYDDFLGQGELAITAATEAGSLVDFVNHVRRHKNDTNFLMTNRDFALGQAANSSSERLREISTQLPRVDVTLSGYGLSTRAEMLFNHLYFTNLGSSEQERFALDGRMMAIVQHPSFNPRTIATITERTGPSSSADEVLDQIIRALDNPAELWEASFAALTSLAKSIVLTLATLPPRPVPHDDLRVLVGADSTTFEWQEALKTLEATWIEVTRSETDRPISFANPGCRDYAINQLDDIDLARDAISRIQSLDQLISMSQSADLLAVEGFFPTTARRPKLASALLDQRTYLSELARTLTEVSRTAGNAESYVISLTEAAALLVIYGATEDAEWLVGLACAFVDDTDQVGAASSSALFVLAWRVHGIEEAPQSARDELVERLASAALATAKTTRDLDGYEALPEAVRTPSVHALATERANDIIGVELAILRDSGSDPVLAAETAVDLEQRALWYGFEVDIAALLERSADASDAGADVPPFIDEAPADSWRDPGGPGETFSRFRNL